MSKLTNAFRILASLVLLYSGMPDASGFSAEVEDELRAFSTDNAFDNACLNDDCDDDDGDFLNVVESAAALAMTPQRALPRLDFCFTTPPAGSEYLHQGSCYICGPPRAILHSM